MEEMITITKEQYFNFRVSEAKLNYLEDSGVDNWDWFGDALNPEDEESFSDYKKRLRKEILGE